jgi:hypothetical protein
MKPRRVLTERPAGERHLVEQALLHLKALDELPAELIVHARIVGTRTTGEEIRRRF